MSQRAFLGGAWARGGSSEVVRRAHPASGAQWNVQVVRGKVNGKCLWNACKALSLGLLLMVLGAAMATIGYYADDLSIAQEVRGNHTVRVKNESRGFHLNNLSYAGPIVMGVGGFIVVAACVMTFEARDSAAKVVPARFKLSTTTPPSTVCAYGGYSRHGSLRTAGSQTGTTVQHTHQHSYYHSSTTDRRALTQSFMHFSRGLALETQHNTNMLKVPQGSINRSPSAPDLILERSGSVEQTSPTLNRRTVNKPNPKLKTFAACALLNPGLLHRHALSVDETGANFRLSNESLHPTGSQGSMAMDLHLEYPVTLRIKDKRRNPLKRQRRVEEDVVNQSSDENYRRSSHSCSPRMPSQNLKDATKGGSAQQLPTHYSHCPVKRRSSNASDCTHRSRARRRECPHSRGRLERAISSDSRLTGAIPKCYHHNHHHHTSKQSSSEQEPGGSSSDTDETALRHKGGGDQRSVSPQRSPLAGASSMGCASSTPLVESGKNLVEGAKESVTDTVAKGEKALHDVGESAKEGFETGIEHVKETVQAVATTAGQGVDTAVEKIGKTLSFTSSKVKESIDNLDDKKDEMIQNATDTTTEAVSDAETVLASEVENAKDEFISSKDAMFENIQNFEEKVQDKPKETKEHISETLDDFEDDIVQNFDMLGDSVNTVGHKVVEELNNTPISSPVKEVKKEVTKDFKKEEQPPTFWEAAADAILLRGTIKTMEMERHFFSQPDKREGDPEPLHHNETVINKFLTKDNENHQS